MGGKGNWFLPRINGETGRSHANGVVHPVDGTLSGESNSALLRQQQGWRNLSKDTGVNILEANQCCEVWWALLCTHTSFQLITLLTGVLIINREHKHALNPPDPRKCILPVLPDSTGLLAELMMQNKDHDSYREGSSRYFRVACYLSSLSSFSCFDMTSLDVCRCCTS